LANNAVPDVTSASQNGKPVTTFENLDIAFEQIATGIRAAIEKLRKSDDGQITRSSEVSLPSHELPAASLDSIVRLLTVYIGPIASVVVRQAAASCRGAPELYEAVALEIANPRDRSRFLFEAGKMNSHAAGK
jgi:hypothetical protein